jgi:hypothetical protein
MTRNHFTVIFLSTANIFESISVFLRKRTCQRLLRSGQDRHDERLIIKGVAAVDDPERGGICSVYLRGEVYLLDVTIKLSYICTDLQIGMNLGETDKRGW